MTETTPPGPEANVTLQEITFETVREICNLSDTLSDAQKRMVAPNAISIAQAHFNEYAWFRAIYADDTPVGFVMLYVGPDEDRGKEKAFYLWRFMIASPHQGKGYGRKALQLIFDHVRDLGAKELDTSVGQGEASPEGFYRSLGFERSGEMFDDEVGLRLALA
ncbi:MAG: GNAT family N-acetyltransferase [Chloroflexota bacterium]|nr:MAG: GNAT family N-acetyltransferase [Chloroflexota bacterium]